MTITRIVRPTAVTRITRSLASVFIFHTLINLI